MPTYTQLQGKFKEHLIKNNKKATTLRSYLGSVEQFHSHLEAEHIKPSQLKRSHMQKFIADLKTQGSTARTISAKTSALRQYSKFLIKQEILKPQTAAMIKHPTITGNSVRPLKAMEYRALRDACRDNSMMFAIVELLLQTGIRVGELVNLTIKDMHLAPGPKYGKMYIRDEEGILERIIPLNNAVEAAVYNYLEDRPKSDSPNLFVLPSGDPIQKRWLRYKMDHFFTEAEITSASVFDLRHTFCVFQLRKGLNLLTVAQWAGHKNLATMEKYKPFVLEYMHENIKPAML